MLYRLYDSIHEDVGNLMNANETLEDALDKINAALATLDTNVWQGESKKAAVDLLLILKKYHEKLIDVAKDNLEAMTKLENNASEYMQNGKMPSLWK